MVREHRMQSDALRALTTVLSTKHIVSSEFLKKDPETAIVSAFDAAVDLVGEDQRALGVFLRSMDDWDVRARCALIFLSLRFSLPIPEVKFLTPKGLLNFIIASHSLRSKKHALPALCASLLYPWVCDYDKFPINRVDAKRFIAAI